MADQAGIINSATGAIVPVNNALVETEPGVWTLQAAAPGYVETSRRVDTTAPLTGGGDLSANRTIAMPAATALTDGYMSIAQAALVDGATDAATANTLAKRDASAGFKAAYLQIDKATGTALTVNSADGLGELPIKVRVAAATSGSGQAGMDYGFSNAYRVTQAVAGSGVSLPWGGSAYLYAAGAPLRLITDNTARGVEFWAGGVYAGRALNGVTQLGAAPSGTSTTGIPLYCGKNAATVQARLGDTSGNCWSVGRDNVASGDLIIEPTVPAGTTPFAAALRVLWASGVARATYGAQIGASGTTLTQAKVYTPNLTPASQGASTLVEQTFAVAGLSTADTVTVNAPGPCAMSARVSAADTLALTFHSPSGGTYTAPAGVYRVIAVRS